MRVAGSDPSEETYRQSQSLETPEQISRDFRSLRHRKLTPTNNREENHLREKLGLHLLVGQSSAFQAVLKKISTLARCDASVLILGGTGTGKELCARAIHYLSTRTQKPFVPVNCGAIPNELVENELFGHVQGAFTGASTPQKGLIAEANGGTLFLDEVACLPLLAQVKLLRFLQERQYRPLGARKSQHVSLRIIAATNVDLAQAVEAGIFRQDLYYRLKVLSIDLPTLRQRPDDIPLLAWHFLRKYADEFNKSVRTFSEEALQLLVNYDWPGNIRELEHSIAGAVALTETDTVEVDDLSIPKTPVPGPLEPFQEAKARIVAQFEKSYIQLALATHQGNITKAARTAGKDRRAFWQLMRKHRISANAYRSTTSLK